ncbi:hypothetical protein MCOR14_001383 [Pyricularia oryzae]|nr:hypothetical protein MCOR22_011630 [Pyricularia oryzae]KAI6620789.1 hypothetical protein MCOR08_008526 [Pyricularia oryzae]KAI6644153.1 hypothetical protein MCOR14_001383 [Pyricularia oryzae]
MHPAFHDPFYTYTIDVTCTKQADIPFSLSLSHTHTHTQDAKMATTPQQQTAGRIIRHNKLRYLHCVDGGKIDELQELFLPSASFTFYERDGSVVNKFGLEWHFASGAAYYAFLQASVGAQPYQMIHLIDAGLFEHVSDDEVRVVWTLFYKSGPLDSLDKGHQDCGARLHETWKRVPGKDDWLLARMELRNIYARIVE